MPSHAQYFKQNDISDCDVAIRWMVTGSTDDEPPAKRGRTSACSPRAEELARFPAHRIVLFTSEYFKAQVRGVVSAHEKCLHSSFLLVLLPAPAGL